MKKKNPPPKPRAAPDEGLADLLVDEQLNADLALRVRHDDHLVINVRHCQLPRHQA